MKNSEILFTPPRDVNSHGPQSYLSIVRDQQPRRIEFYGFYNEGSHLVHAVELATKSIYSEVAYSNDGKKFAYANFTLPSGGYKYNAANWGNDLYKTSEIHVQSISDGKLAKSITGIQGEILALSFVDKEGMSLAAVVAVYELDSLHEEYHYEVKFFETV